MGGAPSAGFPVCGIVFGTELGIVLGAPVLIALIVLIVLGGIEDGLPGKKPGNWKVCIVIAYDPAENAFEEDMRVLNFIDWLERICKLVVVTGRG